MYKCKQHIHKLFWVAGSFLKKIICNELHLCTRNEDGIRRILNCKCTGDFWLLCVAQRISSSISALILNMQSWLCLSCSSYFSVQQSGLECLVSLAAAPAWALPMVLPWLRGSAGLCEQSLTCRIPALPLPGLSSLNYSWAGWFRPGEEGGSLVCVRQGGPVTPTPGVGLGKNSRCYTWRFCLPGLLGFVCCEFPAGNCQGYL